ncbi:MAG: putative lipid II flippase FtsW [Patescibacteria group bacterium]|jgi:cell division protein FtsW
MKKPDYVFIGIIGALLVFGLMILSSATSPVAYEKFGDNYWYLKHQIFFGLLPGLLAFFLMSRLDYRKWKKYALPFLVISIVLLLLVFIPGLGAGYGKARSWINVFGMSLQPSEIVKITFLIYLAAWLGPKRGGRDMQEVGASFIPFAIVFGIIALLMVLQPDIGTLSIIAIISVIVYFSAGAPLSHLGWISGAGVFLFFLLVKFAPYRTARLMTFLHPELDPQGVGYHINQALLAIGSGGFFGLGLGLSRQKFQYLPEVAGDSIFAVMAEELGFIFMILFIAALVGLAIRGFKIAKNAPDGFGRLLAVGITSWFVLQSFINIGAMIGILPLTGIPLPFVSYGGTALTVCLAAAGIMANISKYSRE